MIWSDLISTLLVISFWQTAAPAEPPTGLHCAIEREFIYMASTRTQKSELWLAGDRSYEKRGNQVIINRKDLGVRWMVDAAAKTYTERPLTAAPKVQPAQDKAISSPSASKPAEDMRLAGFDYEPVYDWKVTDTGQTSPIHGRSCTKVLASGDADYSESSLILWLCSRSDSDRAGDPNRLMLDLIRYDSIRTFVESELAERGNPILMTLEETTEPAIAPTMITRIRIASIESAPVPAGLFDLPAGIQKTPAPK